MPLTRILKPSSIKRRRQLVDSFKVLTPAMRVYRNYLKANRLKKYKVRGSSNRYVECARLGYNCNLAPFSPTKWARIKK